MCAAGYYTQNCLLSVAGYITGRVSIVSVCLSVFTGPVARHRGGLGPPAPRTPGREKDEDEVMNEVMGSDPVSAA